MTSSAPGSQIGPYVIMAQLRKGEMGDVHQCDRRRDVDVVSTPRITSRWRAPQRLVTRGISDGKLP